MRTICSSLEQKWLLTLHLDKNSVGCVGWGQLRSPKWHLLVVWQDGLPSLPLNWRGTCTVGFVVTAMRTVPNNDKNLKALFTDYRPPGMRRDKRSLADITLTQAPVSRFF
ncbi:unnamed protein product, partial [Coregonus sp. 'balchen']